MEQRTRSRELRQNATEAERILWRAISARKVAGARFNRQVPVGPFICDFVARSSKLVIEVDGGHHTPQADASRTAYLESQGYEVIRFWNTDVLQNLDGVVATINSKLAGRPSPSPSREREGSKIDAPLANGAASQGRL
jgi:very-short-patch-repair endonuclease